MRRSSRPQSVSRVTDPRRHHCTRPLTPSRPHASPAALALCAAHASRCSTSTSLVRQSSNLPVCQSTAPRPLSAAHCPLAADTDLLRAKILPRTGLQSDRNCTQTQRLVRRRHCPRTGVHFLDLAFGARPPSACLFPLSAPAASAPARIAPHPLPARVTSCRPRPSHYNFTCLADAWALSAARATRQAAATNIRPLFKLEPLREPSQPEPVRSSSGRMPL